MPGKEWENKGEWCRVGVISSNCEDPDRDGANHEKRSSMSAADIYVQLVQLADPFLRFLGHFIPACAAANLTDQAGPVLIIASPTDDRQKRRARTHKRLPCQIPTTSFSK